MWFMNDGNDRSPAESWMSSGVHEWSSDLRSHFTHTHTHTHSHTHTLTLCWHSSRGGGARLWDLLIGWGMQLGIITGAHHFITEHWVIKPILYSFAGRDTDRLSDKVNNAVILDRPSTALPPRIWIKSLLLNKASFFGQKIQYKLWNIITI